MCFVMFKARIFRDINLCLKFSIESRKTFVLFGINMDSVKRKLDEPNNESLNDSKKIKVDSEVPSKHVEKLLENTNKFRKPKKVVFLLSYVGKDYFGLQRNNNVNTIEDELLKALLKANIILQDEFNHPKTMKFQRAARTDKGVSAVRNIVSLKIPLKEISDSFPEKINLLLPPEVRLVALKRVTQSFDAKIACDARTYSYMLPTFAFAPSAEQSTEEYRITEERIKEVNEFLKNYLGTKNFYNFTSGRLPGDPSCKRYIMSCECTSPFESNCLEFCVIKIKGQSFMLHQIRKMVGLAVAIMRNLTDIKILEKCFDNERIDIPKAPGLGLMLEELHYDWYNSKFGSDGIHEPIQWEEYDATVEKFKQENICLNIAKSEREEKSMLQWLETLPHHSYDVRDAGPPTMLPSKLDLVKSVEITNVDSIKTEPEVKEAITDVESIKTEPEIKEDIADSVNCTVNIPELKCESEIKCES